MSEHSHIAPDGTVYTHSHEHKHQHTQTKAVVNRLSRAIGHLESVRKMVEDGRDCTEVLVQLAAVRSALNNTAKVILKDHVEHCLADAVECGALTLEKLEAMTCVCSVGLDMIAIPGDTPATTISGIIADEAAIGMVNQKTTAVRIIPVVGKTVGDTVEFGGLLGHAPVMPVNTFACDAFVNRVGRIPAPIHSFKN